MIKDSLRSRAAQPTAASMASEVLEKEEEGEMEMMKNRGDIGIT